MNVGRLLATALLFLGAFCPVGAHALAHAVNSAHVHGHEHDAEGRHEPEQRCNDGAPRLAEAGAKLAPGPRVAPAIFAAAARVAAYAPRLVVSAVLDPPLIAPQCLAAPSAAGRAPPA